MSEPILKLDELVGRSKPLKVERLGKTYELTRPEGLTLKQNAEWQAMGKKIMQAYGPLAKRNRENHVPYEETLKAMDDCLDMICPEILLEEKTLSFAEKLKKKLHPKSFVNRHPFSFDEKLAVLGFYNTEALGRKITGKVEGRKRHSPNSTGA